LQVVCWAPRQVRELSLMSLTDECCELLEQLKGVPAWVKVTPLAEDTAIVDWEDEQDERRVQVPLCVTLRVLTDRGAIGTVTVQAPPRLS